MKKKMNNKKKKKKMNNKKKKIKKEETKITMTTFFRDGLICIFNDHPSNLTFHQSDFYF